MAVDVTIREDPGFDKTSNYCWVNISVDGVRVGKARGCTGRTRLIIYSLNIFPEFQRNGYARSVIESLQRSFDLIIADRVRGTARGFWTRTGFNPDGHGNYVWRRARSRKSKKHVA